MSINTLFQTSYTNPERIEEISKILNEPEWLIERRKKAFEQFLQLPYDQDDLFYKYTNFRKLNPENLKPAIDISQMDDIDMDTLKLEPLELSLIETEAGLESDISSELVDKGVYFGSLHELIVKKPDLARKIVGKIDEISDNFDKLGMLARAFATNITVLYVPRGVVIDKILFKTISLDNFGITHSSEFIGYFEEDSQVTILESMQSRSNKEQTENLFNAMQTLYLEDNARVVHVQIQNWNDRTYHIMGRYALLGRYSNLKSMTQLQGGSLTRHNSIMDMDGQGSEGYDLFIKFGADRQRFDVKSELHHNGRDTIGNTHARTVMMERAESILRGLIVIPEPGVNADSWLTSQGMTIGKGKIVAIPALKIDQNDVKAAHAASVEPINKELLFYLTSRGINYDNSKEMLIKGYFEYILNNLKDNTIGDISRVFLSEKWDNIGVK